MFVLVNILRNANFLLYIQVISQSCRYHVTQVFKKDLINKFTKTATQLELGK